MAIRKPTITTAGLSPELAKALEPVKQSVEMITGARVGMTEIAGLPQSTSAHALVGKINEIVARINVSGTYTVQRTTASSTFADVGVQPSTFNTAIDNLTTEVSEFEATMTEGLNNKVDRAGDTMTGTLAFDWGSSLGKATLGGLQVLTGTASTNAGMTLFSDKAGVVAGFFRLRAADSSNSAELEGTPTGVLTWDGTIKGTTIQATSDRRLKKNLKKIKSDLEGINVYKYQFRKGNDHSWKVGLLAQEVQSVLPEAVAEDSRGYLSLDYNAVVAALVGEVNKLKKEVSSLKRGGK